MDVLGTLKKLVNQLRKPSMGMRGLIALQIVVVLVSHAMIVLHLMVLLILMVDLALLSIVKEDPDLEFLRWCYLLVMFFLFGVSLLAPLLQPALFPGALDFLGKMSMIDFLVGKVFLFLTRK